MAGAVACAGKRDAEDRSLATSRPDQTSIYLATFVQNDEANLSGRDRGRPLVLKGMRLTSCRDRGITSWAAAVPRPRNLHSLLGCCRTGHRDLRVLVGHDA